MRGAGFCVLAILAIVASDGLSAEQAHDAKTPATGLPAGFDVEFGASAVTDYNFRGFSVSNRGPSVSGYVRPIYHGFYAGLIASTIDLPFGSTALDAHAGFRRQLGPVLFDARFTYYHFPNSVLPTTTVPANFDYWEVQTRPTWIVNDALLLIAHAGHTPSFANSDAPATWLSGSLVVKGPFTPLPGWGAYASAELGHHWLGTTRFNVDLPNYLAWNVGAGLVYRMFTFDLRYFESSMSKEECWVLTGDLGAAPGGIPSPVNPLGLRSNWCGSAIVGKVTFDMTASQLLKLTRP
jgi:uncharacterized protein (TIGR02001 family)